MWGDFFVEKVTTNPGNINLFDKIIFNHNIQLGAQNVSAHEIGAHTGEISISMLKDSNCNWG